MLSQVVIAGAFELPHGLAEGVEVKRVDGAVEGLLYARALGTDNCPVLTTTRGPCSRFT